MQVKGEEDVPFRDGWTEPMNCIEKSIFLRKLNSKKWNKVDVSVKDN